MRDSLPFDKTLRLIGKNLHGYYSNYEKPNMEFAVTTLGSTSFSIYIGGDKTTWEYRINFSCSQASILEGGKSDVYVDYDPLIFNTVNPHNLRYPATWYYIVRRTLEGSGEKWGMECFKSS